MQACPEYEEVQRIEEEEGGMTDPQEMVDTAVAEARERGLLPIPILETAFRLGYHRGAMDGAREIMAAHDRIYAPKPAKPKAPTWWRRVFS